LPRESSRALRRVEEYLKVHGLSGPPAHALARQCAAASFDEDAILHTEGAVREAQRRITAWKAAVFAELDGEPNPLWLRTFLSEKPEVFLADPSVGRTEAAAFGDARSGRIPETLAFRKQSFERPRIPHWLRGLLAPLAMTIVAVGLGIASFEGSPGLLGGAWLTLFAFLFGTTSIGFFTALSGFVQSLRAEHTRVESTGFKSTGFKSTGLNSTGLNSSRSPERVGPLVSGPAGLPRSAVILPIYHEDAARVFANVAAMRESLEQSPGGENFEFFVLSDSQDPAIAADEERAFRRITADAGSTLPVYYRRRSSNERQKVGNLSEFFGRWGTRYQYVIVLDADSLMRGETMVELVRRMEASPRLGLLQAPITQVGGETLLARALQWSSSIAGPLFNAGLAKWAVSHGNYYGHNAVIRTQAFVDCCSLPALMGKPPLGGAILSHDFVEASLLCRDGWQVRTATDLEGSYEGLPPTLSDYIARDRRWCQGNLQHLRVVFAPGLKMMSRIHLSLGAASYLMGPAWLAFLLLGVILAASGGSSPGQSAPVLALSLACLLGPRLLGVTATLLDGPSRRRHGGALGVLLSVPFEMLFTTALAPILLFHHTRIVIAILRGSTARWSGQNRNASSEIGRMLRAELGTTALGGSLALGLFAFAPKLLLWLAPVWVPLLLAMPIALLASSAKVGSLSRSGRLLLIPSEHEAEPLLVRSDELVVFTESDLAGRFRDLILDPVLLDAHIRRVNTRVSGKAIPKPRAASRTTQQAQETNADLRALGERALRLGPTGLSDAEQAALMNAPETLLWLHQEAWCHWPVEAWGVARDQPQLPRAV